MLINFLAIWQSMIYEFKMLSKRLKFFLNLRKWVFVKNGNSFDRIVSKKHIKFYNYDGLSCNLGSFYGAGYVGAGQAE